MRSGPEDGAPIAPSAPPNALPLEQLRIGPGVPGGTIAIGPDDAGWRYLSFATIRLAGGQDLEPARSGHEALVVIVGGGGLDAELAAGPERWPARLAGRASPFDELPTAIYLPPGTSARLAARPSGPGPVELALAWAPAQSRPGVAGAPLVIRPEDVEVEVRGAGNATRQISHLLKPDFPAARLLAVEVLTPSGNWSSWPPHKHDVDAMPEEAVLEEIYHYRFRDPRAWGIQRLYRRPGSIAGGPRDGLWAVRDGDVVLVTDGYHPFVAAHGHDAWYLNCLAGDRRTMACSDDPDLAWVRETWTTMARDARVPLVPGRR